jgi:FKBP-type peptidyl-prolyl cis-trans isomerase FkpA
MRYRMNRILLILLLFAACLSACTKSNDVVAQVNAQGVIDGKIISAYLKSKGLPEQHVDTTGVCYVIDTAGTGDALYTSATQVTLSYTGWLLQTNSTLGKVFGSSGATFHPSFVLGQVIRGWQLGLSAETKIQPGGAITLFVPSRYAYGPYPQPDVGLPANAVLVFHILLYNVTN